MEQLRKVLQNQVRASSKMIYRITKYDLETVNAMLMLCYRAEVARRGCQFVDDVDTRQRVEKAAKWLCQGSKFGLLLYGGLGTGKTTLAKAICSLVDQIEGSVFSSDRRGIYRVSAIELAKNALDNNQYLNRIKGNEMLYIDDLGIEPTTLKVYGNEFSPVTDLLYYRYEMRRFTIATSNLDIKGFGERYGARIQDRMVDMFNKISFGDNSNSKSYRK